MEKMNVEFGLVFVLTIIWFIRVLVNSMIYNEKDGTSVFLLACFGWDCFINGTKSAFTFFWLDFKDDSSSIKRLKIISNVAFFVLVVCLIIFSVVVENFN